MMKKSKQILDKLQKQYKQIYEDKLKDAILSGLSQASHDISNITEMVKNEIGTVIHKNDDQNEYTIKSKIKKLEKEKKEQEAAAK